MEPPQRRTTAAVEEDGCKLAEREEKTGEGRLKVLRKTEEGERERKQNNTKGGTGISHSHPKDKSEEFLFLRNSYSSPCLTTKQGMRNGNGIEGE
ncbi:Uncharacterized protein TCM_039929 [Theobroma cacao]|uniref:Uncharacterized protein n=1 Tax=Theobroma cacao TaxID=3641 RepID=A0A061GS80_THECC|nr:Uncharacterized protein TCM_039929 [Theobroma cacao]